MGKKHKVDVKILVYRLLAVVLFIPLTVFVCTRVPNLDWPLNLDRWLIMLAIIGLLELSVRKFRFIIPALMLFFIGFLTYGTLTSHYSFRRAYVDLKEMAYGAVNEPEHDCTPRHLRPFPHGVKYVEAVDYYNPDIRNYAVSLINDDDLKGYIAAYHDYRRLIQCFAVFRDINKRWTYVNDPLGEEYLVKASDNLEVFSGDCDDHAIMMSACIMSIGGTMRLVYTNGHVYPEILIGSKENLEDVNFLIKQIMFKEESKDQNIHYHTDSQKQVWLNLDYTAHYPGGKFMDTEVIAILYL